MKIYLVMMMKSNMSKIFVSRYLEHDSVLLDHFNKNQWSTTHMSLIEFSSIAFEKPWADWLFFYSKKGVKYYFDQIPVQRVRSHKFACFGPGTASYLLDNYGFMPDFIGTGEKQSTADLFKDTIDDETVCFIAGQNSLRSIQEIWGDGVESSEVCVYNNRPRLSVDLGHYDVAIVTSPMNYESFVTNGGTTNCLISIGKTTSMAIKTKTPQCVYEESAEPSEMSILKTLLSVVS